MKEIEVYNQKRLKDFNLNISHTYLFCKDKIKIDIGKSWRIPTKKELVYLFNEKKLTPLRVYWTNKQLRVMFTSDGKCIFTNSYDKNPLAWVVPVRTIQDLRKVPKKLRPSIRNANKKKHKTMIEAKVYSLDDNDLLNNPKISFSKAMENYVNKKGVVRKNWTLDEELFLIKNIHKGHIFLTKKLKRPYHTIRLKFNKLIGTGYFSLAQKKGQIFWDKLNEKKPNVSKKLGRPRKKKEISKHEFDTYDAKVVDTLHISLNNRDEILDLRNIVTKLSNDMDKYHHLFNDEILKTTNSLQADINKSYNSIQSDLETMHKDIQETFYKVHEHIEDVLVDNKPKRKRLKCSIKLVKGFGLGFGYQNYDDRKFGISIGPVVINIWRE